MESQVKEQTTSGLDKSESRIQFTKLNHQRMKRLDKSAELPNEMIERLKNAPKQTWYVLNETWCGDSAQLLPYINKMAESTPAIDLQILFRDENPEIMEKYLTNGSKSIPKLFSIDEHGKELFTWGPRPERIQKDYLDRIKNGQPKSEAQKQLHAFYAQDKGETLIEDFKALIE